MTSKTLEVSLDALDMHRKYLQELYDNFMKSLKALDKLELSSAHFGDLEKSGQLAKRWKSALAARDDDIAATGNLLRYIMNSLIEVRELYDGTRRAE
ncbi:MAG: hypothetical protein ACRDT6_20985 [Micromonosporaceae bacterium]